MLKKYLGPAFLALFFGMSVAALPLGAAAQDEDQKPATEGSETGSGGGTPATTAPEPDC